MGGVEFSDLKIGMGVSWRIRAFLSRTKRNYSRRLNQVTKFVELFVKLQVTLESYTVDKFVNNGILELSLEAYKLSCIDGLQWPGNL